MDCPGGSVVKNLPTNAGDTGSIPGLGRTPGGGNGNPLQYSCLENSMDRGAWQTTVPGVAKELDMTLWLNNNINYSNHAVHYSPIMAIVKTCLSYNWKLVTLDHLHPFHPLLPLHPYLCNHKSDLVFWVCFVCFWIPHISEIISEMIFVSLSFIPQHNALKSIHVVKNGRISFFMAE